MTPEQTLTAAADVLEAEAFALMECSTDELGEWGEDDEDARASYEYWIELADALRRLAQKEATR